MKLLIKVLKIQYLFYQPMLMLHQLIIKDTANFTKSD